MRRLLALVSCLAAVLAAGCGDRSSITDGGRIPGDTLTVYSLLPRGGPRAGAAAELVLGEKLALAQAGGRAGRFTVNFATADEPVGRGGEVDRGKLAFAVEELVRDTGAIAVIGDLDARTARVSAPLLNAAGVLHVSPGTGSATFAQPAEAPSFFSLVPSDAAQAAALAAKAGGKVAVEAEGTEAAQALAGAIRQRVGRTVVTARAGTVIYAGSDPVNARGVVEGILSENRRAQVLLSQELATTNLAARLGPRVSALTSTPARPPAAFAQAFARAYPGETASPLAAAGWAAMRDVLAAIAAAKGDADDRQAVIDAFAATDPQARADALPTRLIRR